MSIVEVNLVTTHIKLNLGGFVNCMLWKNTGRTRFDSMIGPLITRVCSGLEVPHTLSQVETKTLLVWEDSTTNKVQQFLSTIIPKYGLDDIGLQVNN
jgi:hypothetical protein